MIQSFIEEDNPETRTEVPWFLFGISLIGSIASDQSVYTKNIKLEINFRQMCYEEYEAKWNVRLTKSQGTQEKGSEWLQTEWNQE